MSEAIINSADKPYNLETLNKLKGKIYPSNIEDRAERYVSELFNALMHDPNSLTEGDLYKLYFDKYMDLRNDVRMSYTNIQSKISPEFESVFSGIFYLINTFFNGNNMPDKLFNTELKDLLLILSKEYPEIVRGIDDKVTIPIALDNEERLTTRANGDTIESVVDNIERDRIGKGNIMNATIELSRVEDRFNVFESRKNAINNEFDVTLKMELASENSDLDNMTTLSEMTPDIKHSLENKLDTVIRRIDTDSQKLEPLEDKYYDNLLKINYALSNFHAIKNDYMNTLSKYLENGSTGKMEKVQKKYNTLIETSKSCRDMVKLYEKISQKRISLQKQKARANKLLSLLKIQGKEYTMINSNTIS